METPAQQLDRFKRADERVRLAQQTALSDDRKSYLLDENQLFIVIAAAAAMGARMLSTDELSTAAVDEIYTRLCAGDIVQRARLY